MAKGESIHQKLSRVRKPHVHISYEVEKGDALEVKELPFVVGMLGDYAGDTPQPELEDRKFVEIDRDNINQIMSRIGPSLNFRVENTLASDNTEMAVNLKFNSMESFEPGQVVEQVPALQKMLELRNKLRDLKSYVEKSKGGEKLLEQILQDMDKVRALAGTPGDDSSKS
ncbi:MAG TPA: type VI secretion system contractile sheath small subunit [Pirellulaceae bacterium]|nr:type VI secretion system contractile sheath small subunit [Pirellulaceae bacterium]